MDYYVVKKYLNSIFFVRILFLTLLKLIVSIKVIIKNALTLDFSFFLGYDNGCTSRASKSQLVCMFFFPEKKKIKKLSDPD